MYHHLIVGDFILLFLYFKKNLNYKRDLRKNYCFIYIIIKELKFLFYFIL